MCPTVVRVPRRHTARLQLCRVLVIAGVVTTTLLGCRHKWSSRHQGKWDY